MGQTLTSQQAEGSAVQHVTPARKKPTGGYIVSSGMAVATGSKAVLHADAVPVSGNILLPDHAVGSGGQHGSGGNARGLTGLHRLARAAARVEKLGHQQVRRGFGACARKVGAAGGVAVHLRAVKWRLWQPGVYVCRAHPPVGLKKGKRKGLLHGGGTGQQGSQRLFEGQHALPGSGRGARAV